MLTIVREGRLRSGRWLLLAMLGLLHGVMLLGVDSAWSHPLLLAHFGLFLLWQPLWRGEREVGRGALVSIVFAAVATLFWLNWWLLAFWLIVMFGLVGARVFVFRDRWARMLYLLVIVYLLALLLLWVAPNLFGALTAIEAGGTLIRYVLPVLLLTMVFLPVGGEPVESVHAVDFIYGLLLFLLLTLVVLGGLAFMTLGQLGYLDAILRALLLTGLILLALGGLWGPRFGFGGLQVMFSRYLLNIGTPFESWLMQLAEAAQRSPDPSAYLHRAVALLADFPWLSGLSWRARDEAGQLGKFSEHEVRMQEGELHLTVYAKQAFSPTVLLHLHLLMQLIGHFYQAKQREQSLRDITRLQAVYETGSRLTHDLKNMLQSLLSLASIAQNDEEKARQLLRQQLPQLTRRIELTLGKLQQPQVESVGASIGLAAWWDALRQRNQGHAIKWGAPDAVPDREVPAALFDCVLDNLLDNALKKRQLQPDICISVALHVDPLHLLVCDSGEPIPDVIAANLLRNVVVSQNGLGIGLYQSARWAEQMGYHLKLSSNRQGQVCFDLHE